MAGASKSADSRKRGPVDAEMPLSGEAPLAKRACVEERPTHLTVLEEFYDLEEEDADCGLDSSATGSCAHDDLVAEMMKSLERVIEEGVARGFGEASTSQPAAPDVGSPAPAGGSDAGLTWADDGSITLSGYVSLRTGSFAENRLSSLLDEDEGAQLLPTSNDEIGTPSLASFDTIIDNVSFEGDWASLLEGSDALFSVSSVDWLDAPLAHCEDARDIFEPIVLF